MNGLSKKQITNKVKTFFFNLRASLYYDHKRIRTKNFASVYIYETKCN